MTYPPPLPLEPWEESKVTLHLFSQIVGKTRMALFPKRNHWWHVPLYVSVRGLSTRAIPYHDGVLKMEFDLSAHTLTVDASNGKSSRFDLPGASVADVHRFIRQAMHDLDVDVSIVARPYDHPSKTPFAQDQTPRAYEPDAVHRYWQALVFASGVLEEFAGRFLGKSSPVHLFWHSFDLALTRFSGRPAPPMDEGTPADREAYSHEVVSFGFWAGDAQVREPTFYSYTYPEPPGLADEPLRPSDASWAEQRGSHMALLPYESVRQAREPRVPLLEFLESAYEAGSKRAEWPREELSTTW